MIFVDTNYFLRFFLKDNINQYQTAQKLLIKAAQKKIKLTTSTIVIFEFYWVLKTFYKEDCQSIFKLIKKIFDFGFIQIDDRNIFLQALKDIQIYQNDLEDAYNSTYSLINKVTNIATFDKKLKFNLKKISTLETL